MTAIEHVPNPASLELIAGQGGWSVIDPATVLARLWYFDGKFLRAEGFRREQEYVRSLVAVSNQAVGYGVVHGFTASDGPGDTIRVEPGLALAPSGRPILLTSQQDLPVATLVARSRGGSTGQTSGSFRPAPDFGLCPPDATGEPPDAIGGSGPMWVLYVRAAEALCGEEERFGQLCEDACATETDRSVVVEGVRFFVERLDLPLPTASAVTLDGRHLRSRYASAYFAWERAQTVSLISGAGLRSPVWCRGAEGVGGDAVALGVFDRTGGITSFVDMWTARRELMETSPSRYWAGRMARRSRDVFLAQVLQFQCQLIGLPAGPGQEPGECEDERKALSAANDMLTSLAADFEPGDEKAPPDQPPEVVGMLRARVGAEAYTRIAALQKHLALVLAQGGRPVTGSLLLDHGFVQLPPCGYLPVDPRRSVQEQVRALMGRGVDLRFCAVRADFVGEAFEEAQHLDRISLTQGIDDPGRLEEVDVLVPGGKLTTEHPERSAVFQGVLRVRPQIRLEDKRATTGAAMALSTVAREHTGASWSWVLAGVGENPGNLAVAGFFAAVLVEAGVDPRKLADAGSPVDEQGFEVPFVPDERLDARLGDPGFVQRVARERHYAQARRSRIATLVNQDLHDLVDAVGPDRKVQADEDRPLALWFDVEIQQPLTSLSRGQSAPASVRITVYSRAKERPILADYRITGALAVKDIVTGSAGGGVPQAATIVTTLTGHTDPLLVIGTHTIDQPAAALRALDLTWQVGRATTGAKVMLVALGPPAGADRRIQPTISARDEGTPRHIAARASLTVAGGSILKNKAAVLGDSGQATQSYDIARLDLDELPGGLAEASDARTIAEAAIDMLAAELSLPGRDPSFAPTARQRLLAPDAASQEHHRVAGVADWVFFHRRRTKVCESGVRTPVGVRRYRLHHAVVADRADVSRFLTLGGVQARTADELPGFEAEKLAARIRERSDLDYVHAFPPVSKLGFKPVATLEFEAATSLLVTPASVLRNAWRAGARGTRMVMAAAGDIGIGDGEDVVLGRLATTRGALADLIDQTHVIVRHLPTVPPEFRESGLDGALFTVGLREEEPTAGGCVTLLRLTREALNVLRPLLEVENPDLTLDQVVAALEKARIAVDMFNATFDEGTNVLNEPEVKHWWGPIPPRLAGHLVAKASVDAGDEELWRNRSLTATGALGLSSLELEREIADTGSCGAVLVLMGLEVRTTGDRLRLDH